MRKKIFWTSKILLMIAALIATLAMVWIIGRYVLGVHLLSTFWRCLVVYLSFFLLYNMFLEDHVDRFSDYIAKKISKE